ncbi:MAG: hypothetical protein WEA99_03720 [Brumimicrobium sp.]
MFYKFIIGVYFTVSLSFFGISQSTASLVNIPASVFVNKGKTSFEKILYVDKTVKESIKKLFDLGEIYHELNYKNSTFDKYWEVFNNQWFLIKLNSKNPPLLLFKGFNSFMDEKQYVELYDIREEFQKRIFASAGNLLAYNKHPFTDEIVLFIHKYPCCESASHNIIRVRHINDKIVQSDSFFVGRDSGDMVGPFYPNSVDFPKTYKTLNKKTLLRWSPAVVEQGAFEGRTEKNEIIHYNKGAIYQVLKDQAEWQFVVFYSGIAEEQSMVINYTNFKIRPVYGWIQK